MTGATEDDESHVRVVARIRPLSKTEVERSSLESITSLSSLEKSFRGTFEETNEPEILQVQPPDGQKRWFELDAVFDKNSSQEEVYVKCGAKKAVCENVFKGFNCTILAYGQVCQSKRGIPFAVLVHGCFLFDFYFGFINLSRIVLFNIIFCPFSPLCQPA